MTPGLVRAGFKDFLIFSVIVFDSTSFQKMDDILSDHKKLCKASLKADTLLNFAFKPEKHVKVLKKLV